MLICSVLKEFLKTISNYSKKLNNQQNSSRRQQKRKSCKFKRSIKKAVFNWSGGKDSALALHKVLEEKEFEVIL